MSSSPFRPSRAWLQVLRPSFAKALPAPDGHDERAREFLALLEQAEARGIELMEPDQKN